MNERQQKIQQVINESGEVLFSELERLFPEVSTMTIRRDVKMLEALGEVIHTRCGAKSIAYLSRLKEMIYSEREVKNIAEKSEIAKKAYAFVKPGSSVFLDSGTTVTSLAATFNDENMFVITAAPKIALECAKKPNISVFMTGGQMNSNNLSLSGINAVNFLDNINIDIAFMAASGFSFKSAFTCGNFDECLLKKRAIEKAGTVVMLMDSSKYGKNLPFTFAQPSDVDYLITDGKLDKSAIEEIKKHITEVI